MWPLPVRRSSGAWPRCQRVAFAGRCWSWALMGPMCRHDRSMRGVAGRVKLASGPDARCGKVSGATPRASVFNLIDGDRIVHLLSWHQGQNEAQLGEALKQVKEAGIIPEDKVRLCVVSDGAEWIWKHVQALFPHARQVLDYYHCAAYLHKVAKAQYGPCLQAREWVEATLTRLYMGKVRVVLAGLKRMRPMSEEAAKAIANCLEHLHEHRGRTPYSQLRRGGYPLGSG